MSKINKPTFMHGLIVGHIVATIIACALSHGWKSSNEVKTEPAREAVKGCSLFEYIGNIEITEHDMETDGWEGKLWQSATGYSLGLAVRRICLEDSCVREYTDDYKTKWGRCDSLSEHSPGKYCLIRWKSLTDEGRRIYFRFSDPDVYDALP